METIYDQRGGGMSPQDLSHYYHIALFDRLSEPLKKMQADYLNSVTKNCY